ncbi:nuclear factor 7, ovary-like [Leuresthes tenuis]|uniref:nuclear factor 7, ovary-like n=1 Tax=Leuresthes tenuis TaxID=355514 RepID=UPI003B502E9B
MSSVSEKDLECPICTDIYRDPVVLSCSHSFCRNCLQTWWQERPTYQCPCCKSRSEKSSPPRNLALKNLSEAFLKAREQQASHRPEHLCSLHSEKLKIFCLDHQQPVCVICRDSKIHNNHRFRPIDEAAQEQREELQKSLKPLRDKLKLFEEAKGNCDQTVEYVKDQAQQTERQLREEFQRLHLFLEQEEKARVAALKKEEQQKSQTMKETIQALSRDIAALSDTIRAAEKDLRSEDISFLLSCQAAARRVQQRPLLADPQPVSGALIDVAKHLSNLTLNIWNKLKQTASYSPVVLDPNTADPELIVSPDLSSVRSAERQQLPRNPERTKFPCSVQGSEGFRSGTHSWDVEVGNNKDWELGVLGEDVQVKGRLQAQLWRILFSDGKFTAFSSSDPEKVLQLKNKVQKIRVQLDFDGGKLSFLDLDTNSRIHTFTHTFTGTLFPYIYTENPLPLRILQRPVSQWESKVGRF